MIGIQARALHQGGQALLCGVTDGGHAGGSGRHLRQRAHIRHRSHVADLFERPEQGGDQLWVRANLGWRQKRIEASALGGSQEACV
ncbi:MAG: hypothetical protein A4E73_00608 [Syntrophaceae bacterium PtaU1.Bin231]|nr:MAG: hypothetical protein A4E73_00608 [Syntrophaceae bacterium PtaU1.Bin231]